MLVLLPAVAARAEKVQLRGRHVMELSTRQSYTSVIKRYILPEFRSLRMIGIMPGTVRDFVRKMQNDGASPYVVDKARTILSAGDDRHPAVHLEPEDGGGGWPGPEPGGRGRRPPDDRGGYGVRLRVGDRHGADHRHVPDVLPVVSKDSVQGPQDANYIVKNLHPKALMIVDDQEPYSTGLVAAMVPVFKAAGIKVDHESVSQKVTDFSSLVAKVTPAMSVVVLPWQIAANAQLFGRNLAQQHKKAVIFGTDGLFGPGTFTIPGSYVSMFGPDIRAIPADAAIVAIATARGILGLTGPPTFAATHVVDEAIAAVCKSGQPPSRASVLAAIRKTNEPTSILGQPIRFDSHGDSVHRKFFLYKINSAGNYQLIPG